MQVDLCKQRWIDVDSLGCVQKTIQVKNKFEKNLLRFIKFNEEKFQSSKI